MGLTRNLPGSSPPRLGLLETRLAVPSSLPASERVALRGSLVRCQTGPTCCEATQLSVGKAVTALT